MTLKLVQKLKVPIGVVFKKQGIVLRSLYNIIMKQCLHWTRNNKDDISKQY